jgi:hypothetical protein
MRFSPTGNTFAGQRQFVGPIIGSGKAPLDDLLYERRQTSRGAPFWMPRKHMPRVPDEMLECVFYLYPTEADAYAGEQYGGSGFLVGVESLTVPGNCCGYLVTNRHVVQDGSSPVVRLNTRQGDVDVLPLTEADWIVHPDGDDLAVCPAKLDIGQHHFRALNEGFFLTRDIVRSLAIGPGDDTYQVGRFINHEGRQQNLPTVRCGTIAMMPWEPVLLHDGHLQEAFLVEAHAKPGYSGSPVFVQVVHYRDPTSGETAGPFGRWEPILLGIAQGTILDVRVLEDEKKKGGAWDKPGYRKFIRENTGLEVVIPAWRLMDLLNIPELVEQRARIDNRLAREVKKGSWPL